MRYWPVYLFAAAVTAGSIAFVAGYRQQGRLEAEIARLQRQNSALDRLRREHQRLTASRVPPDELQRLRDHQANLGHLRAALATVRAKLEAQAETQTATEPPKPLAAGMIPVIGLPDAGQATPQAAVQSFFRAVGQVDPDALARQIEFDDAARTKANDLFNSYDDATRQRIGSPERMMAIFFAEYYGRVTGMQSPDFFQSPTPDWGVWRAKVQTSSGRVHDADFPVHRSADGWHEVITVPWIDNWSNYLK